jgi:AAA domain
MPAPQSERERHLLDEHSSAKVEGRGGHGSMNKHRITDPPAAEFRPASTIPNRAMRWALPEFIALGDVTIVAGPKKAGKSLMAAHLAASFTKAVPFAPGLFVRPEAQGQAALYNGERAIDCFAKPRCEAAGADLDSLYIVGDAATLDEIIADVERRPHTIRLVIIDPLKAFIDAAKTATSEPCVRGCHARWPFRNNA